MSTIFISPHFKLSELTTTQHTEFDNSAPPEVQKQLRRLASDCLEPVRAMIGPMSIHSAYRCPDVNKAVGGSPTSRHPHGQACDFDNFGKLTYKQIFEKIAQSDLVFDQLILEFNRWVHIGINDENIKPRRQLLMIGSWTGGKYKVYDANAIPKQ